MLQNFYDHMRYHSSSIIFQDALRNWLTIILGAIGCTCCQRLQAQSPLAQVVSAQDSAVFRHGRGLQPDVYVHTDKSVYVGGEKLWFTAYLLGSPGLHQTLTCLLVEESTRKIAQRQTFVIDNGLACGSFTIHDSCAEGPYRLLAFTDDYYRHPGDYVSQTPITIKTIEKPRMFLDIRDENISGDSVSFTGKVTTLLGGLASGGIASWRLFRGPILMDSGRQVVNAFGELNWRLPIAWFNGQSLRMELLVQRQNEIQRLQKHLPFLRSQVFCTVQPEGGSLIAGRWTSLGLTLRNGAGAPLATHGQIFEDGKPVASFGTDPLGYGIALLYPHAGRQYVIRLDDSNLVTKSVFPDVNPTGISVHVEKAVVTDSNIAAIITGEPGDTCIVRLHNFRRVFHSAAVVLPKAQVGIQLPTSGLPVGTATITIMSVEGTTLAQRAIYIAPKQKIKVEMLADSSSYRPRSNIRLCVRVSDEQGRPVASSFSLSSMLLTRYDSVRGANINRYYDFGRFLSVSEGVLPGGRHLEQTRGIERILLTRMASQRTSLVDEIKMTGVVDSPCLQGQVLLRGKPLHRTVPLLLGGGLRPQVIHTDSTGRFSLASAKLWAEAGQPLFLALTGDKFKDRPFEIKLTNRCLSLEQQLAEIPFGESDYQTAPLSLEEQRALTGSLHAVVVKASTFDNEKMYWGGELPPSAGCNDVVCPYDVINCPVHPQARETPIVGRLYTMVVDGKPIRGIYQGCGEKKAGEKRIHVYLDDAVQLPRPFVMAKYNAELPEYHSTMVWQYQLSTDQTGETILQFPANDLTGTFVCVLQGFTAGGLIQGKTTIKVSATH